jgi:hypothetical protein
MWSMANHALWKAASTMRMKPKNGDKACGENEKEIESEREREKVMVVERDSVEKHGDTSKT